MTARGSPTALAHQGPSQAGSTSDARPLARRDGAPIIGVGELDRRLKGAAESTGRVLVAGEVRGVRDASSGHSYFTLRDENEDAAIDCVAYRTALSIAARDILREGARVVVRGRATVYASRGRLQFTVDEVRPLGRGALLEALERLRDKLASEGLFAREKKRALPAHPRVIGVVTSGDGAAIHDIVKVAFRRSAVRIVLARAPVQGPDAARRIGRALHALGRHPEVEAIVLARGGGSQDDLAAFQDEALVRLVAACPVPIISAIGHEVDTTLVDLAADARAATPSQAAELLVPDDSARRAALAAILVRLGRAMRGSLAQQRRRVDRLASVVERQRPVGRGERALLEGLERRLAARAAPLARARRAELGALTSRLQELHPRAVIAAQRADHAAFVARIEAAHTARVAAGRAELGALAARLDAMSPLRVLGRGYAIVTTDEGRAVRDAREVAVGDRIHARLAAGDITARVEITRHEPGDPRSTPREDP